MLTKTTSILAVVAFGLILSCKQNRQQSPAFSSPKVVAANGYVVPKERMAEPEIKVVTNPKVVSAGSPKQIFNNTNIHAAGIPEVVKAGKSAPCIPGENGYSLPHDTAIIEAPYAAGIPEVILAQKAYARDQNPQGFSSFGKLQGMKNAEIICMLEDKAGNLWFGTFRAGVIKYDGKYFTHFTQREGLGNNTVWCMREDKNGNLWFGTEGGVIKYDGSYFTRLTINDGLGNDIIRSILQDKDGALWFGTNGGGVSRYDGKRLSQFSEKQGLTGRFVYSMLQDRNGNIWFGTTHGVSKFDGKRFQNFTVDVGLPNEIVECMIEDSRGNIWFGTHDGISKYDGQTFTNSAKKQGVPNNIIKSILEDKYGNLWFGTQDGGAFKYDGKNFTDFNEEEGLSANGVYSILEDNRGKLWFGTFGGGVDKYDGETFTHFTRGQGVNNNLVRSILRDKDGNLWFGTNGGLNIYSAEDVQHGNKKFVAITTKEGLSTNFIRSIVQDHNGNFWFATFGGGLNKYDGRTFTHFNLDDGLIDNWIWKIIEDRNGNIWSAGGWGVSKYDGKSFTNFKMAQGLSDDFVTEILEDRNGNLWFGTKAGGVTKYDGKTFVQFTRKQGLSNDNVRSILEDKSGNLWFGTGGGGVNKYDGKTFTHFTVKEGLSDDFVESLMEDNQGNLWVGTSNGLSKLDKEYAKSVGRPSNRYFRTYTYEDGFTGIGVNSGNTMCEGKDGTIWIGADDRLTAFRPGKESKDTMPPNLQLTGLSLFNENIPWQNLLSSKNEPSNKSDSGIVLQNGVTVHDFHFDSVSKWYGVPRNLNLAYDNNYFTIQFLGVTIQSPNKVRYQYKLEGLDENWSALSARSEATYGHVPFGEYIFKVKAMNGDGYWSKELSYPLVIRPPWWRTWWSSLIFALVFCGIVYSVLKYRLNRIHEQHEIELERHRAAELEMQALRAQMNPHFIFNSLNSINLFILENDRQRASEYLTKFSRLIRLILHNSREEVIPLEKELEALNLYLELESLRFERRFKYKISVENNVDVTQVKVPPLIIQPLAENAIWHGLMQKKEEGHLEIRLEQQEATLFCKIIDDGIGRKKSAESKNKFSSGGKSLGMRITANRIANLKNDAQDNNQIEVTDIVREDGSSGGTEVLLKIPVLT